MLDSQPAGGPYTIVATSVVNKTAVNITLNDVLFGDVWLCGGQSNMQFTVSQVCPVAIFFNHSSAAYPDKVSKGRTDFVLCFYFSEVT